MGEPYAHIYVADDQPATRFFLEVQIGEVWKKMWFTRRRRSLVWCSSCHKRRWSANCIAHVYYDYTAFYCRKGKGCRDD